MNLKAIFYKKINQISLKTQLASLIITIFSIIIVSIIVYNYHSNSKTIIAEQNSTIATLLKLETQNLDAYFSEIDRYSLLLRHDGSFMQVISSDQVLTYAAQTMIQTLLRSNFDSRNDLLSYRLYILNSSTNYEIDARHHKVQSFYNETVENLPDYDIFIKGRYYKSTQPTDNTDSFMIFYRTIIEIEDQKPLAIVELTFDKSYIESLVRNRQDANELLCIVDKQDRLLYTNNPDFVTPNTIKDWPSCFEQISNNNFTTVIQDESYHVVYNLSRKYGYRLYNLKPISEIDKQLTKTRNISLFLGFLSITVATILVIIFIDLITSPLSTLAHHFHKVGSGNFTTTTNVGGSLEIANLAENFNSMIYQIDDLIKKTYISELHEKTAQLIALEAQLNPHFLYNTLQAISAEAIVNDQPRINYMITALGSILRYTIKGDNFVTLTNETKHVKDYLLLQHARFEEHLSYEMHIAENTKSLFIPKISIQTLVENSINHGMVDTVYDVHIIIDSYIERETLMIIVRDNGRGISKERLDIINHNLKNSHLTHKQPTGIGLVNLHSRLQILFDQKASLTISSIQNQETTVALAIPVIKDCPNV